MRYPQRHDYRRPHSRPARRPRRHRIRRDFVIRHRPHPMKTHPCLPRIIALAILAVIVLLASTGCVWSRYKEARKSTPLPQLLNVAFAPAPLEAALSTLITYNGPGSWKRHAFWAEYVVTR